MKKTLLNYLLVTLVIFGGMFQTAIAQVLYVENFDYSVSTALSDVGFTASATGTPILVNSPGLSYAAYPGSAIGNASYQSAADAEDARINFVETSISTGTVYMAALVNVTEATVGGDYFFTLANSSGTKRGRIWARDDGAGNLQIGLAKGTEAVTWSSATYTKGTTYLYVYKYTFNPAANDDVAELFVFEAGVDTYPTSEPVSATISPDPAGASDASNLKRVYLQQTVGAQSVIDGIRITQTWEDAVTLSNDATLSDLLVDGVSVTGFTPATLAYDVELTPGTVTVPPVTATTTDFTATKVITDAADVTGQATVVVTAEDNIATSTYTIDFSLATASGEKAILSFDIPGQVSSAIDAGAFTVNILMSEGTDPSALTPAITVSDKASISPLTGVSQDFSSPVVYTVTAEDASTQVWTVTVEVYSPMQAVYEPFDYPADVLLNGQGEWSALNTAGNSEILVSEGSLSYSMLEPPLANKASFDGTGTDISMSFESQNTPGTTVYFSFILEVTDMSQVTSADGTHIAGFAVPSSTYGCGVYFKWDQVPSSNQFYIGTATRSTSNSLNTGLIEWTTEKYDINTPILIVGAYEIIEGAQNDRSYMWVNPASTDFGTLSAPTPLLSPPTVGGTDSDLSSVGRFYIRQDGSTSTPFIDLDELRIGINWADVTPKAKQITFYPADNATDVAKEITPSITYIAPVRQVGGVAIEDADLASLLTFKVGDASGADVPFTATISEDKRVITIDPVDNLALETIFYLAVGSVENVNSDLITGESATFTTRVAETNALLTALSYNNIPVPGFDGATNTYDIVLDYGTTDIPVLTWTLSDPNASAEATDLSAFPGASTVTVTAEDGTTENIYTINFSVSATMSSDATLKEIRINGELLPGFDPSVYEYQYALPFGTTGPAVISAVANSLVATVSYSQPGSATSLGGVTVTAQNGTESQYAIFFSINPYIYTVGWETASLPFDGWSTENTIISTNFGTEPITNHGDFPGVYAFRFICGKAASGSVSGSLTTSMYPKSGVLKFWLYMYNCPTGMKE